MCSKVFIRARFAKHPKDGTSNTIAVVVAISLFIMLWLHFSHSFHDYVACVRCGAMSVFEKTRKRFKTASNLSLLFLSFVQCRHICISLFVWSFHFYIKIHCCCLAWFATSRRFEVTKRNVRWAKTNTPVWKKERKMTIVMLVKS